MEGIINNTVDWIRTVRVISYYVGMLILTVLGILALATFIYVFKQAFTSLAVPFWSLEGFYSITKNVIDDEAAWGAFGILIANLTFYTRHHSISTQYDTYCLQKERWDVEKVTAEDERNKLLTEKNRKSFQDSFM